MLERIVSRGVRVEEVEPAHPAVLENVDAGLDESTKYGVPLPKIVRVTSKFAEDADDVPGIPAGYNKREDAVLINPKSRFFKNGMIEATEYVRRFHEMRRWSTDSVMHVLRHELSHCAHYHHDQKSYGVDEFEDPSHRELAMDQVGKYAGASPRNFVAEVRTALLDGKKFSDEVKKWYLYYSGGLDR